MVGSAAVCRRLLAVSCKVLPVKSSILLVMDMMNDLLDEAGVGGSTYGVQVKRRGVLDNTAAAIAAARAAGVPVGFVRVGFSSDYREAPAASRIFSGARKSGIFQFGGWGTEMPEAIKPRPEDYDIRKHRVSPFYGTALEPILRARGVERLLLCGVSTNGVVHSGARDGHDRDYECVVLEDCCAGASEDEHRQALACMDRYARIATGADIDFKG